MALRYSMWVVLMVMLVGCGVSSTAMPIREMVAPPVTTTETIVPTATSSAINTRVPTATHIPTIAATPTLPEDFFSTFLFQGTQYPNCELPCWRGLVIGESTLEGAKTMLQRDFQLSLNPLSDDEFSVLWQLWTSEQGTYGMGFWIEEETNLLHAINFFWDHDYGTGVSPQRIIQEFGAPDQWWFEVETTMGPYFDSAMVYSEGLIFMHSSPHEGGSSEADVRFEFCLDSDRFFGSAFIAAPSESYSTEIPPLLVHLARVGSSPRVTAETTIEDVTGYSIDETVALALSTSDPCIEFEY